METKNNNGVTFNGQMIIKIVIGIVFIAVGLILMFKNNATNNKTVNLSYKYEQANARLIKTVKNGDSYEAYYEYTYNDKTYKALYDKQLKNEGDAEKDTIIQVNRENPEDYVFGEKEEPKTNYSAMVVPGILILFGLASIFLSIKGII